MNRYQQLIVSNVTSRATLTTEDSTPASRSHDERPCVLQRKHPLKRLLHCCMIVSISWAEHLALPKRSAALLLECNFANHVLLGGKPVHNFFINFCLPIRSQITWHRDIVDANPASCFEQVCDWRKFNRVARRHVTILPRRRSNTSKWKVGRKEPGIAYQSFTFIDDLRSCCQAKRSMAARL